MAKKPTVRRKQARPFSRQNLLVIFCGAVAVILLLSNVFSAQKEETPTEDLARSNVDDLTDYALSLVDGEGVENHAVVEFGETRIEIDVTPTEEVSLGTRQKMTEVISFAAETFLAMGEVNSDDLVYTYVPPKLQIIVLLNRMEGVPDVLRRTNEASVIGGEDSDMILSLINFASPNNERTQEYREVWLAIHVVCLGGAENLRTVDAICNIISRNAGLAYLRVDRLEAETYMNSLGTMDVSHIGGVNYESRFIPAVYDAFLRR